MAHLEFDLDLEWMLETFGNQQRCPLFGYELDWDSTKVSKMSATLDRFDPSRGYTKNNVWVICGLANMMKSNATINEQIHFAESILEIAHSLAKK